MSEPGHSGMMPCGWEGDSKDISWPAQAGLRRTHPSHRLFFRYERLRGAVWSAIWSPPRPRMTRCHRMSFQTSLCSTRLASLDRQLSSLAGRHIPPLQGLRSHSPTPTVISGCAKQTLHRKRSTCGAPDPQGASHRDTVRRAAGVAKSVKLQL
jgi:hypothetical protein